MILAELRGFNTMGLSGLFGLFGFSGLFGLPVFSVWGGLSENRNGNRETGILTHTQPG